MQKQYGQSEPSVVEYAHQLCRPQDEFLRQIRERAAAAGMPAIHVGDFDGLHLEILTRAIGAKKAVEIGTLAGYSGTSILRGMGRGGKLYTFEFAPLHAQVATETFKLGGFTDQVELHVGPALDNLSKVERHGPFDLIFIDADKVNYPNYLKWAARNLRVGGTLIADNTFGWGFIAADTLPADQADGVKALRVFNRELAALSNFRFTMLPTSEGMSVGVRVE